MTQENNLPLLEQAKAALRRGDRTLARRLAQQFVSAHPADVEGWLLLGGLSSLKASLAYLNKAAESFYAGGRSLIGSSLLDCHNEQSCQQMIEILERMKQGLDEELITDNKKYRIYMRAVRSETGTLIGYYERYEPPRGQ